MNLDRILSFCNDNNIEVTGSKSNILFLIMKFFLETESSSNFIADGCLEVINNNYGFLRDINTNFNPSAHDIYVHPKFIKENNLKCGDIIECEVNLPRTEDQKLVIMKKLLSVNGNSNFSKFRRNFEDLTPFYSKEQLILANDSLDKENQIICRALDLISPVGFGQRGLIVAPPKCGKTTVLHSIVMSILLNPRKIKLIVVLVGERPEEVTVMKRIAPETEIVFSTFDEPEENQIRMTEIINERAKRLVENGEDVVILLDSITRLARSYNYSVPSSGKIMTGGVDPAALIKPKKFFGSARNTEEAGSLTVLATCLVETGSKMDDFIFEELKGTGNAEIRLSRSIAQRRVFPAIDISESGARRTDLFVDKTLLPKIKIMESFFSNMDDRSEAIKILIEKIRITKTNRDLLVTMLG